MNILKAALSWLLTKHAKKEQTKMSKIALMLSVTSYVLTVTVTDDSDVPIVGAGVVLTGDAGVTFTPDSLTTGDAGTATSALSAAAGTYTVTASLADGTTASTSVTFAAPDTAEVAQTASTGIVAAVEDETEAFIATLKKLVAAAGSQAHAVFDDLIELAKKLK